MAVTPRLRVRRPPSVQLLVGALALAGAAAVGRGAEVVTSGPASAWAAAAAIAVAVVVTDQLTLDLPHGGEVERLGLTDAVWVAAIVLAPAGAPTLGAAAGALVWQLLRRVPPTKLVFNVGQVAVALCIAEVVWGLPAETPAAESPAAWALAAAAAAVAFAFNEITVALAIALSSRTRLRDVLLPSLRVSVLQWAAAIAVGLLAAVAWSAHPAGVLLVIPPLVLVWLAHREFIAGLVEREQMQDLATTAERIARDRDPAARLPTTARTGRLADLTAGLNRMLAELERASGRERHLMRAAADELQEPVRRITRFLERDGSSPARGTVLSDARRVTQVLEEMDSVVRAARPGAVQPTWVALDSFLHHVGAEAASGLADRLTVVAPEADAEAHIDARWMERALLQLLDNARVHGRRPSRVELRVARTAGGWRFEVADEGGGVPPGHEDAVFEPFYRMSSAARRPGLGLALVRGVADAHGGSAGIANRPGVGATFWLRVPG
jgi:signal transduction histidine kinase